MTEPDDQIEDLGLPTRVRNCLLQSKIHTVAQLVVLSSGDILELHGMGEVGLHAIESALETRGLRLADKPVAAAPRARKRWTSESLIYAPSATHRRIAEVDVAIEAKVLPHAKRLLRLYLDDQTNSWAALTTALRDTFGNRPQSVVEMLARLAIRTVIRERDDPP